MNDDPKIPREVAGAGSSLSPCSASFDALEEIKDARRQVLAKYGEEESDFMADQMAAAQWRRMRSGEELCGYIWLLLDHGIGMRSELGLALMEIMDRVRDTKPKHKHLDDMVAEILGQNVERVHPYQRRRTSITGLVV